MGIRTSKARTGLRTRLACHRRWSVYGNLCRHTPEVGAVCGKAARTVLCGGRASLPLLKRRKFMTLLGGAAAAWPLAARAQQPERIRRIGMFAGLSETDPELQARKGAFLQALQQLGWTDGRNAHIDYRLDGGDTSKDAAELVALAPDVI